MQFLYRPITPIPATRAIKYKMNCTYLSYMGNSDRAAIGYVPFGVVGGFIYMFRTDWFVPDCWE